MNTRAEFSDEGDGGVPVKVAAWGNDGLMILSIGVGDSDVVDEHGAYQIDVATDEGIERLKAIRNVVDDAMNGAMRIRQARKKTPQERLSEFEPRGGLSVDAVAEVPPS